MVAHSWVVRCWGLVGCWEEIPHEHGVAVPVAKTAVPALNKQELVEPESNPEPSFELMRHLEETD